MTSIDPSSVQNRARELFRAELADVRTDAALQALRTRWVGRNNSWTAAFMEALKTATPEQKKTLGKGANELKKEVEAALADRETALASTRRPVNAVDITLPGRVPQLGHRHPLSLVRDEVIEIFTRLGYQVLEGPEIEDDYHNFEALNMPADHPARDMHDTLYLREPLAVRRSPADAAAHAHQRDADPAHGEECAAGAAGGDWPGLSQGQSRSHAHADVPPGRGPRRRQGHHAGRSQGHAERDGAGAVRRRREVRFRPSFFPYTEPSAEVDIRCFKCEGAGCAICKSTGWIEILGSGMVHPAVFEAVGYNADEVTGFAFGMGVERVAQLKWGVEDIRLFYENDLRFLEQFGL